MLGGTQILYMGSRTQKVLQRKDSTILFSMFGADCTKVYMKQFRLKQSTVGSCAIIFFPNSNPFVVLKPANIIFGKKNFQLSL